jgi:alpha-beta hydrolase superfamily lysophospholipase
VWRRLLAIALLTLSAAACAPRVQGLGPQLGSGEIREGFFVARDGVSLPLGEWLPGKEPEAVLLALHGFNMYRLYFEEMAPWLGERGIATYAYDQRGFGMAPEPGIWGGRRALRADVVDLLSAIRDRHPGLPLYVMGVSMGGAVAVDALAEPDGPLVDGVILVAPALWGGEAMGSFARFGLWFAAHTVPAATSTGRDFDRRPSDNIEMLRKLGRDPLIIKETRIDAVYGLSLLMQQGYEKASAVMPEKLVLFGRKDEIIPLAPVARAYEAMPANKRLLYYNDGWHMLLRDLQAETVWRDIAAWIKDPTAPFPSGAEAESFTK